MQDEMRFEEVTAPRPSWEVAFYHEATTDRERLLILFEMLAQVLRAVEKKHAVSEGAR